MDFCPASVVVVVAVVVVVVVVDGVGGPLVLRDSWREKQSFLDALKDAKIILQFSLVGLTQQSVHRGVSETTNEQEASSILNFEKKSSTSSRVCGSGGGGGGFGVCADVERVSTEKCWWVCGGVVLLLLVNSHKGLTTLL